MTVRRLVGRVVRRPQTDRGPLPDPLLAHAASTDRAIVERALRYSITGPARVLALIDAVKYCVERSLPGAFAECGVWLGGSVLAMILTLQELGVTDRDIYLYDTFEGMTTPTEKDVSALEQPALTTWREAHNGSQRPWGDLFDPRLFNADVVRATLEGTGYPSERLHFVCGAVEETIPATVPEALALMRLDTDWYESTRHELIHLFPRLVSGGVLIVDDYGHWQGARQAVDEYFATEHPSLLLTRVDYAARIAVKH